MKTMRGLAVALVMLVLSPAARAVPITGYAIGAVTQNRSTVGSTVRQFMVGEPVYVRFTYDLDPVIEPGFPPFFNRVVPVIAVMTGGGFNTRSPMIPSLARATQIGETLFLHTSRDPVFFTLRFTGDVGQLEYGADLGSPNLGFLASVTRVADDSAFPTPEPSTLAMGLAGVGMLGVAAMRRRRAAA